MSVPVFDDREIKNLKTISGLIKKAKTLNSVQCTVLQWEALHSPSRETGPTELFPQKPYPTFQHQVPTALNPVWEHLCSTCAYSFYVWTSRMCPQVPASLLYVALAYERLPRGALLSDSGEIWTRHCRWDLLFPFSRPLSQVTILLLANLWFILPLNHVLISPYFISMPLHSVEKLDTVLIVCLKHPLSSDHLVSFHFLLISCTPLYKN